MDTKNTFPNNKLHSLGNFSSAQTFNVDITKDFVLRYYLGSHILPGKSHLCQEFPFLLICIFAQNFLLISKLESSFLLNSSHLDIPQALQTQHATNNFSPQVTVPLEFPDYPLLTQSLKPDTLELISSYFFSRTTSSLRQILIISHLEYYNHNLLGLRFLK